MRTIVRLAWNTCRECLREPVCCLMLLTAAILNGTFPYLALFVFRQQLKMVADSAMASTLIFGLFAAVICSSHTISREMRNGTVLLLMSKPVSRAAFLSAKVLGMLAALTAFVLVSGSSAWIACLVAQDQFHLNDGLAATFYLAHCLCALYGAARNYFSQKSFCSNATAAMTTVLPLLAVAAHVMRTAGMFQGDFGPRNFLPAGELLPALLLLLFAVWIMGAISATLAMRLDVVGNLLICLLILMGGLVARYCAVRLFGQETPWALFVSTVIPNWQNYWMADALSHHVRIPASYLLWAGCYALLHMIGWFCWGYYLFRGSELAKDAR